MRLATIADVEAAMAKPPLTERQHIPASNMLAAQDLVARMDKRRSREQEALERKATQDAFADDLAALIRILRTRDNLPVTEQHISERVANAVTALFGSYRIERLP